MRNEYTVPLEDGPWTHLLDAGPGEAGSYQRGENIYPQDARVADSLVGRPGRRRTNLDYIVAPIPGTGIRIIQGVATFRGPIFRRTVAVVDGNVFTYNWTTDVWSAGPSPAVLAGAAITMDALTPTIYLVQLRAGLLFTDGINTPWVWDGSNFVGASVTKLTNAPIFFGKPVLRAGRLFAIKAADTTKLTWSETDLPNTGYETGGYNNVWQLTQSDPNPLTALDADNEGLTVFRRRSATRVYGDDPQDFVTGNAEDTLAENVGVVSPNAIVPFARGVVVVDGNLKVHWVRPSAAGATPLWHGFEATIMGVARASALGSVNVYAEFIMGAYYPPANLLLLVSRLGSAAITTDSFVPESFVFVLDASADPPVPVGIWRGLGNIQTLAMVTNDSNEDSDEYLMFGADGEIFILPPPWAGALNDAASAPGDPARPIQHVLETRPLGYSTTSDKIFDRLDLLGASSTAQTLVVSLLSSDISAPAQTVTLPAATSADVDVRLELGIEGRGRWGRVRIAHAALDEEFNLSALAVTAVVAGREPKGR